MTIPALIAVAALSSDVRAQDDASGPQPAARGSVPVAVLIVEAVAFGSGLASRWETGARVVGAVHGISGVTVLGIAAASSREAGWPQFLVPYGIGLLGLAGYNFAAASSATKRERFWTNAIGFNAVVAASVLSAVIWRAELRSSPVAVHLGPSGPAVHIAF